MHFVCLLGEPNDVSLLFSAKLELDERFYVTIQEE